MGVTDPNGASLGSGQVTLPGGGWWVIGIGPGELDGQTPPPTTDPGTGPVVDPIGGGGGNGDGNPIPDPPQDTGGGGTNTGGPVATPEPATAVLLGLGSASLAAYRRLRR